MGMERYYQNTGRSDEHILKAFEESGWNLVKTASALGYKSNTSLYNRLKKSPSILAEYEKHNKKQVHKAQPQRTDEEYLEAIAKSGGLQSVVAEILGLHVNSVYSRIARNPELRQALYNAGERQKDKAERKLFDLIEAGDFQAVKFFLSTRARDRGYGEKVEISASMNVEHNWNLQLLGVNDLLLLEDIARRALPEGEKPEIVDGEFTETPAKSSTD